MMKNKQQGDKGIQRLIQWAEKQEQVRAMLLTSTRANPHVAVDLLSDYDVVLVVPDIQPFHTDRNWLRDFGEVLVAYWDPIQPWPDYGVEYFGNVIQYADGLKIDFTLWPIALCQQIVAAPVLPADLDDGYTILLDKDHLTDGMKAPTYTVYIPAPPSAETYQRMIEEFFSNSTLTLTAIKLRNFVGAVCNRTALVEPRICGCKPHSVSRTENMRLQTAPTVLGFA